MYVGGPGSNQYGGRPRDSMCILVATVKIIPTTSRVCHLLQLYLKQPDNNMNVTLDTVVALPGYHGEINTYVSRY